MAGRITGALLALAMSTGLASADEQSRTKLLLFGGALMQGHFPGSAIIPFGSGFDGNYIVGGAVSRPVYRFAHGVSVGVEAGLAARFGRDFTGEAWAGVSLGHEGWSIGPVTVAPALVVGLSAVTAASGIEARRAGANGDASFLFYLGPEIALRHKSLPNVELVYRIHHRSGAWHTLGNMRDAYNANVIGLRFAF